MTDKDLLSYLGTYRRMLLKLIANSKRWISTSYSPASWKGEVPCRCESGKESAGSINCWEFQERPSDYQRMTDVFIINFFKGLFLFSGSFWNLRLPKYRTKEETPFRKPTYELDPYCSHRDAAHNAIPQESDIVNKTHQIFILYNEPTNPKLICNLLYRFLL